MVKKTEKNKTKSDEKGGLILEFVFILPIFFLFLAFVVDFILIFYHQSQLEYTLFDYEKKRDSGCNEEELRTFLIVKGFKENDLSFQHKNNQLMIFYKHPFLTPLFRKIYAQDYIELKGIVFIPATDLDQE